MEKASAETILFFLGMAGAIFAPNAIVFWCSAIMVAAAFYLRFRIK